MASIGKLKDRARKHEQKESWQAAIEAYQEVIAKEEKADELEVELGLYNRIGDLYLRLGRIGEAVSYYETAADKYAESGFFNNAIALCNKALRHKPDRPEIYLKLSRLCAEQGFQTDARRWILEYSERQMRAGKPEEALTGLEDFADLSDDPEIRETLARELRSHDRDAEALGQLQHAYRLRSQRGEGAAAAAVLQQAREIDPSAAWEGAGGPVGATEAIGSDTRGEGTDQPPDEGSRELPGLEISHAGPPDAVDGPGASGGGDLLGEIETFDRGPGDVKEPGDDEPESVSETTPGELTAADPAAAADEADPAADADEPLPFIDTGYQDASEHEDASGVEQVPIEQGPDADAAGMDEAIADEEAEPLPFIDTGYDESPADGSAAVEPAPVDEDADEPDEPGVPAEPEGPAGDEVPADSTESEEPAAEAGDPADVDELGDLDLPPDMPVEDETGADLSMGGDLELDLDTFDLGLDVETTQAGEPEEVDVESVLDRARDMVSRGLLDSALGELRVLSVNDDDPAVFRDALDIVTEIIRRDSNNLPALQRKVEYAEDLSDRKLLIEAYIDLADAMARLGGETKAQAIYERVLDLDPMNAAATEALGGEVVDDEPVDLGAVLQDHDAERASGSADQESDEASDPGFAAMLSQFKAKVTDQGEVDDAGDHYDLGLAFKEMGLIDEAIAEFQTALMGGTERLKVYEELGQCFIRKGQYNVALKVLQRALKAPASDEEEMIGVYYHMGQCYEQLGQRAQARDAYEKVLALDPSFQDVPERVARL